VGSRRPAEDARTALLGGVDRQGDDRIVGGVDEVRIDHDDRPKETAIEAAPPGSRGLHPPYELAEDAQTHRDAARDTDDWPELTVLILDANPAPAHDRHVVAGCDE
jgi:hypothetical protein